MIGKPFDQAAPIIHTLNKHGYECFFVGGSVRDFQLKRTIGDVDLATDADPHTVQQLFKRTIPVGIEHGTILVLLNDNSYEVTTYRTEGEYKDHRHPEQVFFVNNIEEDLSRRDFTINAMAMGLDGKIIDPFNGLQDLKSKRIQTVRHAQDRFNEDALRMLRAIRFSSQLEFFIDDEVVTAIKENRSLLDAISVERITVELTKMFGGNGVVRALEYLKETNLYQKLPIFRENEEVFSQVYKRLREPISDQAVLIAYLHLMEPSISISTWCKAYKLSNAVKRKATIIHEAFDQHQTTGLTNDLLYQLTFDHIPSWNEYIRLAEGKSYDLSELYSMFEQLPIKQKSDLAINGSDLIRLFPGRKKGKWISDYLSELEYQVLRQELPNQKDEIERQVKTWNQTEQN
uniref:CCA tRNA nucleotidyltransferase n=1 Tax=uncultured Allobacillus sp. TaxID=1638025 RepID=UPI002591A70E|nr:CCA tRNA nucleotidyltransferase [uncultured Allobacillus sp.]